MGCLKEAGAMLSSLVSKIDFVQVIDGSIISIFVSHHCQVRSHVDHVCFGVNHAARTHWPISKEGVCKQKSDDSRVETHLTPVFVTLAQPDRLVFSDI